MKVDRNVVTEIARLAHLELKEEETELFARQLQQILQYIEQLNEAEHAAGPFSYEEFLQYYHCTDQCYPKSLSLQKI